METKTIHQGMKEYFVMGQWIYGGTAEIDLCVRLQHKAAIISRSLERSGRVGKDRGGRPCEKFLEKRMVKNPNGKGQVVQYRLISTTPPKVLPQFARDDFNVHSIPND